MSKFNFDSEFHRRIIARSKATCRIPPVSQLVREAVEEFYDEYDYYPTLAVYAPGTFTIMGDHIEYVKGNLVQCALPLGTVVVGKPFCSIKCKLTTTSTDVKGLKKSVFPITHSKKNLKVFPDWVNHVKGVINKFPCDNLTGFDCAIHSSVPFCQGFGSSAALHVSFFTFLEACLGKDPNDGKTVKGKVCQTAERFANKKQKVMGEWNNFTSAMTEKNRGVLINCRTEDVSLFDMRDVNILFLIIYPNFEIEKRDRDLVKKREMELKLAEQLLDLENIIDATSEHLEVLENLEDPNIDGVVEYFKTFCSDESVINETVDELFDNPEEESVFEDDTVERSSTENQETNSPGKQEEKENEKLEELPGEGETEKPGREPCIPQMGGKLTWNSVIKPHRAPVSYIQAQIAKLCEDKQDMGMDLPKRICEPVDNWKGLENLSSRSGVTVCGKLLKRVRHVITENSRSLELPGIIRRLDYEELGTKLIQSHLSLKLDFDVSCPTLDNLVQLAIDSDSVYGAKMMSGGGVLVLLHRRVLESFIQSVITKFGDRFQFYSVFPCGGAKFTSVGTKMNPRSALCRTFLNQEELMKSAVERFQATYNYRPTHGALAPGVVQFLGEHTDYNHGVTMSAGVNMLTIIVGAHNGTSKVRASTTVTFEGDPSKVIFTLPEGEAELQPGTVKWARYIKGVIVHFKGYVKGFDCLICTAVPCSVGMGSKAALLACCYTFLEELSGERTTNVAEKVHRCMLAAQEFTKALAGINELTASIRSKPDFLSFIDTRNTITTLIPCLNPSLTYVLMLTNMYAYENRSLFTTRVEECFEVARALGGKTLRCLTMKQIEALRKSKKKISEGKLRRAEHVIKENERVMKAAEALKNGDYETVGELMVASHNSLRDLYEVVCPEIDALVKLSMEVDGVLGSKIASTSIRLSSISLVKLWAVDDLIDYLRKHSKVELEFYRLFTTHGCAPIDIKSYVESLPSPQFVFEDIFPF